MNNNQLLPSRSRMFAAALLFVGITLVLPDAAMARNRRRDPVEAQDEQVMAARQEQLAQARMSLRTAQYSVALVAPMAIRDLEQSAAYRDALSARDRAAAAYDAARAKVLAEVRVTAEWRRLSNELQDILWRQRDANSRQALAFQALEARTAVTQFESAAMAAAPEVAAARERLIDAANAVRDLRSACEQSIRGSAEWKQAQASLASAQSAVERALVNLASDPRPAASASTAGESYDWGSASQQASAETRVEARCDACNAKVSPDSKVGDRCPHCGALWSYKREVPAR